MKPPFQNEFVAQVFHNYPQPWRSHLLALRAYLFVVAKKHQVGRVQESLKWGEPSYLVKGGSPVRMAWNAKRPNQYGLYFQCQSKLVETFKILFGNLTYEGNRAILFGDEPFPSPEIESCLLLAFGYKKRIDLPLLGETTRLSEAT